MAVRIIVVFIGCLFLVLGTAHAAPRNIEICAACHGVDGSGVGYSYVPIIAGTPAPHLEEALFSYKDGARKCVGVPVMCEAIEPLSDEEIIEMAAYYAEMPRLSTDEDYDPQLATAGKALHDTQCAQCHVLPTDEDVDYALGIPLNGQKGSYVRLALGAYMTGERETLVPVMAERIKELDQSQIEALVHYYASWDPQP